MGGGLLQLVAYGAQDIYLTGNPQITFFKVVYRRHTNFAMECIEQIFASSVGANSSNVNTVISRNGDLISGMHLDIKMADQGSTIAAGTFLNWINNTEGVIYYDFETTGLNPFHDKITEYCFLSQEGKILHGLIDPEVIISKRIIKITNITNELVKGKPKIWQELPKIVNFIKNSYKSVYLIAHNNDGFDKI